MSEIEVKVLDIDVEDVRKRITGLGATLVKRGREVNRMLDHPDGRLWAAGSYVRLRTFQGRTTLTFKRRLPGDAYKISEEIETQVADEGCMVGILGALGLVTRRVDEKDRESYRWGAILFEIDHWPTIPPYLEIEAPTQAEVEQGLAALHIPRDERVTSARLDEILLHRYGRAVPANLRFDASPSTDAVAESREPCEGGGHRQTDE